ncbi:MAG: PTS fructose transporter subunit IIC [Tepidisphaeraceae bacterium]|jgi:fructose-specific phosphotransferase system IIC component
MVNYLKKLRQHLLTGVSYAIPFIACGGIMIALAIACVPMTSTGPDFSYSPNAKLINDIGGTSFKLMYGVLAGYIAYAIANRPGLVPGFIGGYLSGDKDAGFLGALLIGLVAGHLVELIKKLPVSRYVRPIMPILIIPVLSSTVVGVLMLKVLGPPIADLNTFLKVWLQSMNAGNAVFLAMILGAMIAFDMGGPVNKAAFFFGAAMIKEGHYAVMGACAAAICTPPLGLGLATLLDRKHWSEEEREVGIAALGMGMFGITEGAIPFAAADPLRVIPCIMFGSIVASVVAMLGKVGDHAPHGGPIVLPVVDHRIMYVIAIIAGTLATAAAISVVKRFSRTQPQPTTEAA